MLSSTEMTESVRRDQSPALRLPIGADENITRETIETEVIQSIKNGKIEFLRVVLESGDEQRILQSERELYQTNLKLSLTHLEYQLLNEQKNTINEYIDKISNGENVALLKSELYTRLKEFNDSMIEKARLLNTEAICKLKTKLKLLDIEDTDNFTLQAFHYNHFKQYEIKIPIQSVSATLEKISSDISQHEITIENLTKKSHDLWDKIKMLHASYEQFISDMKAYFINILSTNNMKIPFRFNFKISDKKRIDEFLSIKVNPNMVDTTNGDKLLHIAIDHDREDIVNLLLERGADPFTKNKAGISAYEKVSLLPNPKYLKILSSHLDKNPFIDLANIKLPKEITDIINPILNEARIILEKYCTTLENRKSLCLFLQIMLHYTPLLQSRSQDYAVYTDKLRIASRDNDPNVFFNEVIKRSSNAQRGIFNLSSLHDPLMELMERFMKAFDTYAFNELKNQVKIPELPFKEKHSTNEDLVRTLTSKLNSANNEIALLKAKLRKADEKSNEPEKEKSHSLIKTNSY